MFDLKEFIKANLIEGVKNGSFTRAYGNILAVNYLSKGMLDETDLQEIDVATVPEEDVTEEVTTEEIVEETVEETVEEAVENAVEEVADETEGAE